MILVPAAILARPCILRILPFSCFNLIPIDLEFLFVWRARSALVLPAGLGTLTRGRAYSSPILKNKIKNHSTVTHQVHHSMTGPRAR